MGIAERREREREELRTRIIEAARDLLSEEGLAGFSMRAIAERIEYSPATIYLYFKDKEALVREVVEAGFERLGAAMEDAIEALGPGADPLDQYAAAGRAYARFALENTAFFRVMFELPGVAQIAEGDCAKHAERAQQGQGAAARCFDFIASIVEGAAEHGLIRVANPKYAPLLGWGTVHGLTTLYLSGRLAGRIDSPEAFLELIEQAIESIGVGLKPRETVS